MNTVAQRTTRPANLRFVGAFLKRTTIFAGVFAILSPGQIDLAPLIGRDSKLAVGFTNSAEARAVARRPVHRPAHRPVHLPAHRPVHRPAHPVHRPIHGRPVVIAPIRPIPAVRPWYWGTVV